MASLPDGLVTGLRPLACDFGFPILDPLFQGLGLVEGPAANARGFSMMTKRPTSQSFALCQVDVIQWNPGLDARMGLRGAVRTGHENDGRSVP